MPWESSVNNSVASNWGSGSLELLCLFLFEMHRHHHGGSWVIPVMRFEMLNYIWSMFMVKTFHSSTFKLQSEITSLVNYLWCQIGVSLPAPSVNDSSPEFTVYSVTIVYLSLTPSLWIGKKRLSQTTIATNQIESVKLFIPLMLGGSFLLCDTAKLTPFAGV